MYTAVKNLLKEMTARVEVLADRIAERQDAIAAMEELLEQHHTAMQVIVDDMNRQEKYNYEDRCLLNELDHYKLQLEDMVASDQMESMAEELGQCVPYACDVCRMPREADERLCEECAKKFNVPVKITRPVVTLSPALVFTQELADKMKEHIGHDVEIVTYGSKEVDVNIALECLDCNEVLFDKEIEEVI